MIKGIGIDIIEIYRIEEAIERNKRFIERIFTEKEIEYFQKVNYNTNTIAGNFAAKEAIMKVLGTGLRNFKLKDIEVVRNELGKPEAILHNNAKKIKEQLGISNIMISISHSKKYAVANAVGE
ncbi:holo-ACP synthase [Anaeromicrobium sediminis]|uniref:Holo-[acyl-carrier-protein] synthase n=1 Tax=Anaeromicrobium sediminis TaxID=1478221 RepID=A0A267MIX6_9FIRM|nr:holo-ACP synthase [Anaeromicrobium sediminis]PAB58750.1 holo-ACP synthase [Anaeromicrobium sediminis]